MYHNKRKKDDKRRIVKERNTRIEETISDCRRPQMRIDLSGVRLDIEGDVAIVFLGKTRRHEVVTANTKLDITVTSFLNIFVIFHKVYQRY